MGFFDELVGAFVQGMVEGIIQEMTGEREGWCAGCGRVKIRYNVKKQGNGPFYCRKCYEQRKREQEESVDGLHSETWVNQRGDVGKILSNDNDPDSEIHLHKHPDGITISDYERDPLTGKMVPKGRYNFNTGEDETPKR